MLVFIGPPQEGIIVLLGLNIATTDPRVADRQGNRNRNMNTNTVRGFPLRVCLVEYFNYLETHSLVWVDMGKAT